MNAIRIGITAALLMLLAGLPARAIDVKKADQSRTSKKRAASAATKLPAHFDLLDLSEKQRQQLLATQDEAQAKTTEARKQLADAQKRVAEVQQRLREIEVGQTAALAKILTDDQKAKLTALARPAARAPLRAGTQPSLAD